MRSPVRLDGDKVYPPAVAGCSVSSPRLCWISACQSARHCQIVGDDSGVFLEDLGSSNGTYVRVRSGDVIPFGALMLIGQKLFRIDKAV